MLKTGNGLECQDQAQVCTNAPRSSLEFAVKPASTLTSRMCSYPNLCQRLYTVPFSRIWKLHSDPGSKRAFSVRVGRGNEQGAPKWVRILRYCNKMQVSFDEILPLLPLAKLNSNFLHFTLLYNYKF